jgi:hypothetical protein
MKSSLFLMMSVFVLISCNNKQSEKDEKKDTIAVSVKPDTANVKTDSHYFWASELDPKMGLVMKRTNPVSTDSLTVQNMIQFLNRQYPEIFLDFEKVTNDSIFVKIIKSNYLTRQMGSSGAEAYMAEVTYNLTEIKGINCVFFRFKEGDHASPGVYTRTDFVKLKN